MTISEEVRCKSKLIAQYTRAESRHRKLVKWWMMEVEAGSGVRNSGVDERFRLPELRWEECMDITCLNDKHTNQFGW